MSEFLSKWGPTLLGFAVSLGAVGLAASLWKRLMDFLRLKIETGKFSKNEQIEAFLDKLALQAVAYVEQKGQEFIEKYSTKMESGDKLALAKSKLGEWAGELGAPVTDKDATEYVETAHAMMEKAADFRVAAGSTSASGTAAKGSKPK